jgi:hypothetical protein
MVTKGTPDEARDAFRRQAWSAARVAYASASDKAALTPDDLERYAIAAHLVGQESESRQALARGYRVSLDTDDAIRAARFAFLIAHSMIFTDELAQANGWIARARNRLSQRGADCVEWGYLLIVPGAQQLFAEDASTACDTFTQALAIGRRFADPNLLAMAGHCRGRALIRLGLTDQGMAMLDEVMVAVATGEVSPLIVGNVYCGVLEACQEVFDLRRARMDGRFYALV